MTEKQFLKDKDSKDFISLKNFKTQVHIRDGEVP
jgi:hypothetical protein